MVQSKSSGEVPRRALGRTSVEVSALALGGSHIAETKSKRESLQIVREAVDAGIDFMDNAWEYHDGRSEELMGEALAGGLRQKVFLMSKVCTHGRRSFRARARRFAHRRNEIETRVFAGRPRSRGRRD